MTNNPHAPEGGYDPAGSTQMFRAFVDEGGAQRQAPAASSGSRTGLITGVVAVIAIVAVAAWLALS